MTNAVEIDFLENGEGMIRRGAVLERKESRYAISYTVMAAIDTRRGRKVLVAWPTWGRSRSDMQARWIPEDDILENYREVGHAGLS